MDNPKRIQEGYQPISKVRDGFRPCPDKAEKGYQPAPAGTVAPPAMPPAGLASNIQHPRIPTPTPNK